MKQVNELSAKELKRMTILVVDDSEVSTSLIHDALAPQGHTIEKVSCGQEALDWLQAVEPDLVLLDYKLPDFNGNVLIKRLADLGMKIPFIIITGQGNEKIAVEMMHLGALDYLVKDEAFIEMLPAVVEQNLQFISTQKELLAAEEELRALKEELTVKENLFSELFSHMPSGVAIYEAVDNGDDFVFADINPAAEQIDHICRDEIIGRRLSSAFPGAEEMGLTSALRKTWQTGKEQELPATYYRDAYREGWRKNLIYRLPSGLIVAVYDDITERMKLMEAESRSAQLAALGTVAAGVAHEINNPLQGILNYATMINQSPENSMHVADIAQRIIKESERIANLTKDLLYYSKESHVDKIPSDLEEIVTRTLNLIGTKIESRGVAIVSNFDANLPVIAVRPQNIQQVVINLIDNACDALCDKHLSSEDKVINVSTYIRHIGQTRYLCLDVYDQGVGMSPDVLRRSKEAFFSTKPSSKGTGLGLSIVNDIITKHNGQLEIESKEGEYTRVKVLFPVASPCEA